MILLCPGVYWVPGVLEEKSRSWLYPNGQQEGTMNVWSPDNAVIDGTAPPVLAIDAWTKTSAVKQRLRRAKKGKYWQATR
jgi:hypothetical protein